jgi:hypothetical protein
MNTTQHLRRAGRMRIGLRDRRRAKVDRSAGSIGGSIILREHPPPSRASAARTSSEQPVLAVNSRLRFALFAVLVLGVPAVLMQGPDAQTVDLGKLALILGPAIFGNALAFGPGIRSGPIVWRHVALAGVATLAICALSLAASILANQSNFSGPELDRPATIAALAGTCLTSVLEELGWALGGLTLAVRAWGERAEVFVPGCVWALWLLVPVALDVGLFPELERAPPLMLAAFVACCIAFRALLTGFVVRANSWLAAAVAHLVPNLFVTSFIAGGLVVLPAADDWVLFPAPGGVLFLALVLLAATGLYARTGAGRT